MPRFDPELLLQAQGVRAAIFDVDGVLTDGRIYIGARGEEFKAFNTLDGQGMKLLAAVGIEPIVITGRDSDAVRRRVADLGIAHALYGAHDKLAAAAQLMQPLGLEWTRMAVMGDDWPDLPLMSRAAFACAPANAHTDAKGVARYVTSAVGGHGAAREFCDLLLTASGRYADLLAGHLVTLDAASGSEGTACVSDLVEELARDPSLGPESVLEPLDEAPGAPRVSLGQRVLDTASTYLPLILMTLLALGTWWLATNAPGSDQPQRPAVQRHDPDYTMSDFTVQRFTAAGPLKEQIEGTQLRHYPDSDTVEIDDAKIRSVGADGRITNATAKRALSNGDGSEVQLLGEARVIQQATATEEAIEFRGEFLHAFLTTERVQSHLPVTLIKGSTEIRGDTLDYDNLERIVNLKGRVKAIFPAPPVAVVAQKKLR